MIRLSLDRIGTIMAPNPDDPREAAGVLNPASARSRDGTLYLFPRTMAQGNLSRIALGRVQFDTAGDPVAVQRLGYVLEPHESEPSFTSVEDPRITYLPLLDCYVMAYTALGPKGPRVALAVSRDLLAWERLGLVRTGRHDEVNFDRYSDKDGVLFPAPVLDPTGEPAIALLHRPTYLVRKPDGTEFSLVPHGIWDARPSIWISYIPVEPVRQDTRALTQVQDTALVATPREPWEALKIGAGPPPILTDQGWLLFYHGISGSEADHDVRYQVGVMLLARDDPRQVLDRSQEPVLSPVEPTEIAGSVPNVVFPTAVDVRGQRLDLYYGAADSSIAVATTCLNVPISQAPSAPSVAATPATRPGQA